VVRSVVFGQANYLRRTEHCALAVELANWFVVMVKGFLQFLHKRQKI
jgi:hypothetical protein